MATSPKLYLLGALLVGFLLPFQAMAQDVDDDLFMEDEEESVSLDELQQAQADAEARDPNAQIGEDRLANFELDRGFYLSSDVGVLISLGGIQGYSNLQPFVSVRGGYDLSDMFSVQGSVSMGYISQNPISEYDVPLSAGRQIASYDMTMFAIEGLASFRPTERIAIEPKLGAGLTLLSPAPTDAAIAAAQGCSIDCAMSPVAPHAMAGVDIKYLTLLTDFSAGVSMTGYFVIGPNILAVSGAFLVRYTFS
ncbi:MAG: adventurous gliding motility protein CglE [Deltaproteobacteria bacterium]|nr:adventurous gliding motility protein CglE [Deltaproteobacteria bacterium]